LKKDRRTLQSRQMGIEAVLLHEFLMRAGFDDAALIHDHDAVGLLHCRQSVRNDQCSPVRH